ncbi:flagellar basal body rod C-terminal domain-containing protein [Azospirillum sp. BE72]|uniref:flagellar basal body rod protein FlgC n=1 Tax=Azospirillum sp. BE72 TaxID=2817776 RepID=UPI002858C1BE|nr:flagellar basal body rod C-terminal domain-containing protein [Azospirillum sp. BE72]MDR6773385.1 flagellar basal-body rod protein FlgC [Azospirillum sp. BE72]
MVGSIGIALSGLTAQTRRLDASASNVANVRSTGTIPAADGMTSNGTGGDQRAAYQPLAVAQTDANPGTRATFTPITPAYLQEYAPDDSAANADGMVAAPNVDLAKERVNQIAANRAYGANIAVVRTQDEMLTSLLNSKA